ncbi:hypothetical protein KM043_016531 [Ampulex compressa]|nr:hypothetical protein KM043_016531 [Ampulex compressa]
MSGGRVIALTQAVPAQENRNKQGGERSLRRSRRRAIGGGEARMLAACPRHASKPEVMTSRPATQQNCHVVDSTSLVALRAKEEGRR